MAKYTRRLPIIVFDRADMDNSTIFFIWPSSTFLLSTIPSLSIYASKQKLTANLPIPPIETNGSLFPPFRFLFGCSVWSGRQWQSNLITAQTLRIWYWCSNRDIQSFSNFWFETLVDASNKIINWNEQTSKMTCYSTYICLLLAVVSVSRRAWILIDTHNSIWRQT